VNKQSLSREGLGEKFRTTLGRQTFKSQLTRLLLHQYIIATS
jgi:hypothetical protein